MQGGGSQPYTLVVLYRGHVYNLKIRKRPDTKVALGEEKSDELVRLSLHSNLELYVYVFITSFGSYCY